MAFFKSDTYQTHKIDKVFNRSTSLTDADNTIEGGKCTWVIPTLGASRTITVLRPDFTRSSQLQQEDGKPVIIIKCIGDASVNNAIIVSHNGAITPGTNTLYTFAADYSATPRFIVLRVSATFGADGRPIWEIA